MNILSKLLTASTLCLIACSSEPTTSQGDPNESPAFSAEQQPPKSSGALKVVAFLRGAAPDEGVAKAFEQGMQLARDAASPAAPLLNVLDRSQGNPENASFQAIAKSGENSVLVYWQMDDLAPAAPTLRDVPVVAISAWSVSKKMAAFGMNTFGFGYSTEGTFAALAKFAGNDLKSYRFGIISSETAPFTTQSRAFVEKTKSLGNTVVFDEKVASTGTDYSALVSRATKENCDTIFAVLPGDSLVGLIKAARSAAYKGKILVGDTFFASQLAALGTEAEGIYVTQAWSEDATFKGQFVQKFGSEPDGVTLGAAALGYDLIKCIKDAAVSTDSQTLSHSWFSNSCEGLTGITQFSGERIAQRQKRILTVKDGKFQLVAG